MVLVRGGQSARAGGKRGGGRPGAALRQALVGALAVAMAGCGYHAGSRATILPPTVKTIAAPAFANATPNYRLPALLTADVTRELISRTKYNIVTDPAQADVVLAGTLVNFISS